MARRREPLHKEEKKQAKKYSSILSWWNEALKYREQYEESWERSMKYYLGNQWAADSSVEWHPVVNIIFKNIETILPIIADSEPTVYIDYSRGGLNKDEARVLEKYLQDEWVKEDIREALWAGVKLALIHGTSAFFVQAIVNQDNEIDYSVEPLSVWEFYVDPYAKKFEHSRYFIRKIYSDKDTIKNLYGVEPESDNETRDREDDDITLTRYAFYELWTKNKIYTIINSSVVKEEDHNKGRLPFTVLKDYEVPGNPYGIGEADIVLDLQREINKRLDQIITNVDLSGALRFITNNGDIEITNEAGSKIVTENPEDFITPVSPMPMPNGFFNQVEFTLGLNKQISGITDITVGDIGRKTLSGDAISMLTHSNYTRIRQKTRHLEKVVRDMLEMIARIVTQKSKKQGEVNIDGDVVKFNSTNYRGKDFKVKLIPGSALPKDKQSNDSMYMALYDRGVFGQPGTPQAADILLNLLNVKGKDLIINKLQGGGQQQQPQQQPAEQGQGGYNG